jgi:hypothetical protein
VWLFTKWGLNFITLQSQQDQQLLPTAWNPPPEKAFYG